MYKNLLTFLIGHVIVHGVVLLSIFDIYYQSTVVENIRPLQWSIGNAAATRLVLFVADGLRADKFYELNEENTSRAPFLRDIILHNATWGVSHTRAPTESRPAHIAMLGGFFEDPNTLMAKFQDNLVEFDTVLNESRETWAWGGSDVLPFFNKGSARSHVHVDCHDYNEGKLSKLDVWVFNKVKELFSNAKSNEKLREKLMQDKIIFFLHLAGIDSNGHRHHPGSRFYLENIGVVDQGIEEIVELFNGFYRNDEKTAYIFTADHGMTDPDGGHGGGSPTEIKTPIVSWGAGISSKLVETAASELTNEEIKETNNWRLNPKMRSDISQLDISVMMAALLGVPYPVNSLGSLPMAYLGGGERVNALQSFARASQMVEGFFTKKSYVQKNVFYIWFRSFQRNEVKICDEMIFNIKKKLDNGNYGPAIAKSKILFEYATKGLQYYQYYHRTNIYMCIISSLFGWMILATLMAFQEKTFIQGTRTEVVKTSFVSYFGLVFAICILLIRLRMFEVTWSYYIYVIMPVLIWYLVSTKIPYLLSAMKILQKGRVGVAFFIPLMAACLYISTAGFFKKNVFIVLTIAVSIIGLITTKSKNRLAKVAWAALCLCLLPFFRFTEIVRSDEKKDLVFLGGICASFLCFCLRILHSKRKRKEPAVPRRTIVLCSYITSILPFTSGFFGYFAPVYSTLLARGILFFSWVIPIFCSTDVYDRLVTLHIWHLSSYILLSQGHDALFYVIWTALLHTWIILEDEQSILKMTNITQDKDIENVDPEAELRSENTRNQNLSGLDDVRRTCIVLFFLLIAFFGLYSVECFNHFRVRRLPFLPITNSFTLLLLNFYKIFLHYLTVGISICAIASLRKTSGFVNLYIAVILSDILTVYFLFQVRDTGSWAEIGFSIANFGIVIGLPIGLLILVLIGKMLLSIRLPKRLQL
ncbi:GPI ethanolamine phosphate transferase 1-like [Styela clava]